MELLGILLLAVVILVIVSAYAFAVSAPGGPHQNNAVPMTGAAPDATDAAQEFADAHNAAHQAAMAAHNAAHQAAVDAAHQAAQATHHHHA